MRAHILIGIVLTVLFGVRAAYPQAAAESVLLHGNSTAATAKTGTTLGNALNKAANKLGNQIQAVPRTSAVEVKIERSPRTSTPAAPPAATAKPKSTGGSTSAGGSLITSIQGGRVTRSSPAPATPPAK